MFTRHNTSSTWRLARLAAAMFYMYVIHLNQPCVVIVTVFVAVVFDYNSNVLHDIHGGSEGSLEES